MATDMSAGPGAFRRLMNKVATWSEALNKGRGICTGGVECAGFVQGRYGCVYPALYILVADIRLRQYRD